MKTREDRKNVLITAWMKDDSTWRDVAIRNVSSHGVMVSLPDPPKRGSYVEIRRGALVIVGRVMWSKSQSCGLRTHEKLSLPVLGELTAAQPGVRPDAPAGPRMRQLAQRPEDIAEQAAIASRRLQFVILSVACTAAICALAFVAYHWLAQPFGNISTALG